MADSKKITIVHVSDFHVKLGLEFDLKRRVGAFIEDVSSMVPNPDYVIVSGDVAFSGKKEQFKLASDAFFLPLIEKTGICREHIIVAPGNHDYDREKVNVLFKDGLQAELAKGDLSGLLNDAIFNAPAEEYKAFLLSNGFVGVGAKVFKNGPLDVGIAVLPTARAEVGAESMKGGVKLPIELLKNLAHQIDQCGLKIAVLHHPLDWFSDSQQQTIVSFLKSEFDLILCGHIHEGDSEMTISPNGTYLYGTASTFMRGSDNAGTEGYNVYEVDLNERIFSAHYRQYVSLRNAYDSDNIRAQCGLFRCALPKDSVVRQRSLIVRGQELGLCKKLDDEVAQALVKSQHLDVPIYIDPPIVLCEIDSDGREHVKRVADSEFSAKTNVFFAPKDAGITTFFKKNCASINRNEGLSVIISGTRFKEMRGDDALRKFVAKVYGISTTDIDLENVIIFVDDLDCSSNEEFDGLRPLFQCVKRSYVGIRNRIFFDGLVRSNTERGVNFYRMGYWSARNVKEFIERYIDAIGWDVADIDPTIRFIVKSLSRTDIPLSPFLVGLYVHVFVAGQGVFTSLNFGELMNNIEARCLGISGRSNTNTVHYYQLFLQMMARACLRRRQLTISKEEATQEFEKHIKSCGMDAGIEDKLKRLVDVGILTEYNDGAVHYVGFACFMFFRHYLSYSFDDGTLRIGDYLSGPDKISEIGDALPYYVARHRGERSILDELMSTVERCFPLQEEVTPAILEGYATKLIVPVEEKTAEAKAAEITSANCNTPVDDEEMEHGRVNKVESERACLQPDKNVSNIGELDTRVNVLGILYNVFRNLEEIPLEDKVLLIDKVLDFHLSCNMKLVEYLARATAPVKGMTSLFAYLTTLGGLGFLSENIASSNLKKTIRNAYSRAKNPLKKLLLLCVEMEIGMEDYITQLPDLLFEEDASLPIIEIGYFKLMDCMVYCKKEHISRDLLDAFKKVYDLRRSRYGKRGFRRDGDIEFDNTIQAIKKSHILQLADIKKGNVSDLTLLVKD